ncbi:MAG TPA: NFACT RNA binding domain-containing protein [Ktedonobacteraceae bacterium]|nr:NFACT RNA binding domain-containing protein [Ktedonobacteraceae bacterium]
MYVDAMTLAAIADEWQVLLMGARIDTIIQPTTHAIALQCYAPGGQGQGGHNRWLYLSAHPQLARAHITALKPPKIASEPPPFVMLLRKHLEGARIESVIQPRWERVLELGVGYRKNPESDERAHFRLIVEIMGNHSNIVLCDEENMILGSLKRVGSDINRYRVTMAGVPYVPPPPQQRTVVGQSLPRLEPTTITAAQLSMCAAEELEAVPAAPVQKKRQRAPEPPKLWQLLSRNLIGCSPLLAREFVYRACEDAELLVSQAREQETLWEELAWNIRELSKAYDTHEWRPQLVERVNVQPAVPVAFAAYVLEQYSLTEQVRIRESPSLNVLLDDYFARAEWRDAMDSERAPVRKVLQTQIERCKRRAELLLQDLAASKEAVNYRLYGDLLLAHQHEVPQGPSSILLQNLFEMDSEGHAPEVRVPLDPRFDAVGNANRLFNKYHKLRRAFELVPEQIEQNTAELATLEQLMADLILAETPPEVVLVKAEVQSAGYIRGKILAKRDQKAAKKAKGKGAKGKPVPPGGGVPLHLQSRDGFTILIGKNSRQNEDVTFHQATANDIWLHARGVPGSHVIIKAAGREVPHSTIDEAAGLAAYYSQSRGSTSVAVDYTLQRHVRHMKGGGPGMVIYEREKTMYAEPPVSTHS